MKLAVIFVFAIILIYPTVAFAQNAQTDKTNTTSNPEQNPLETIAREITKISKSVASLNTRMKNFSEIFSGNQATSLNERQQKLLAAFEFLNRGEERLAVLQKLKIDLTEKQTSVRIQLAKINDEIRPEGIDRSVVLRGTTNAEEARELRRQYLSKERNELNALVNEIQNTIYETSAEIRQTELFLKNIRQRIFPGIERELSDL